MLLCDNSQLKMDDILEDLNEKKLFSGIMLVEENTKDRDV